MYPSIYLSIYLSSVGQINLVPNPSFEDTVGGNCWIQMRLGFTSTWAGNTRFWYSSSDFGSPDFYNVCANYFPGNPPPNSASVPLHCRGFQYPHTGNSYAGRVI